MVAPDTVTDPPHSISFPARCADCQAVAAYPFLASTVKDLANTLCIGLRCRACQHEWYLHFRTTREGLHEIRDLPAAD